MFLLKKIPRHQQPDTEQPLIRAEPHHHSVQIQRDEFRRALTENIFISCLKNCQTALFCSTASVHGDSRLWSWCTAWAPFMQLPISALLHNFRRPKVSRLWIKGSSEWEVSRRHFTSMICSDLLTINHICHTWLGPRAGTAGGGHEWAEGGGLRPVRFIWESRFMSRSLLKPEETKRPKHKSCSRSESIVSSS